MASFSGSAEPLVFLEVSLCFSLFEASLFELPLLSFSLFEAALFELPLLSFSLFEPAPSSELEVALLFVLLDGVEELVAAGLLLWLDAVAAGLAVAPTDAAGEAAGLVLGTGVPIGVAEAFGAGVVVAVGAGEGVAGTGEVVAAGLAETLVEVLEPDWVVTLRLLLELTLTLIPTPGCKP